MRAEDSQFLLWDHTCEQTPPIGSHFEQWLHADERVVLSLEMCGSAAPTIIARGIDQARSNRVQLDVPRCCQQAGFIEHERSAASLPEVSPPAFPKVDLPSISPMRLTDPRISEGAGRQEAAPLHWFADRLISTFSFDLGMRWASNAWSERGKDPDNEVNPQPGNPGCFHSRSLQV